MLSPVKVCASGALRLIAGQLPVAVMGGVLELLELLELPALLPALLEEAEEASLEELLLAPCEELLLDGVVGVLLPAHRRRPRRHKRPAVMQ